MKYETPPVLDMQYTLNAPIDGSTLDSWITKMGHATIKGTMAARGQIYFIEHVIDLSGEKTRSALK
jgi:hypothetical protein